MEYASSVGLTGDPFGKRREKYIEAWLVVATRKVHECFLDLVVEYLMRTNFRVHVKR
jgi:hypothetical protein